MKYFIGLFLVAFFFFSCESYKPPKIYNFDHSRVIQKDFDVTWSKLIQWFGNNNTPIKTIEKASGIISTEYRLKTDAVSNAMDCGTSGFGATIKQNGYTGNFNIVVEKLSENSTKVTINTFFNGLRDDLQYIDGKYVNIETKIDCNSTGYLEKEILDYISK